MKMHDLGTSLFWLGFSTMIFVQSLRMGIGTLQEPGMGFMIFGASGLLGILSVALFLKSWLKNGATERECLFSGVLWKRVLFVLVALALYARFMPLLGYLISTFLLMTFLFWIVMGEHTWWGVLLSSVLVTLSTYYVFSVWLNCQFPPGLFAL